MGKMSYRGKRAVAFRSVGSAVIGGQRSPGFKQLVLDDGTELFVGGEDAKFADCLAYGTKLGVDCSLIKGLASNE